MGFEPMVFKHKYFDLANQRFQPTQPPRIKKYYSLTLL
jgi:hypothetical protein